MIDTKALITAVKDHPCLWHYSDSDYMNKEVRDKTWEEVGRTVLPDWDQRTDRFAKCGELKRKWANIRDSYRKEFHRSRRAGVADTGRPKKEYVFADLLTFLRPVLRRRAPRCPTETTSQGTSGDAVAEKDECTAAEDPQQPTPAAAKKARADPGSGVPIVWVRSLQGGAPDNSPLLPTPQATSGSEGPQRKDPRHVRASPSVGNPHHIPLPPLIPLHPPPYQQQQHQLSSPHYQQSVAREQDPDLAFLCSFLPDMRSMSELQKMDFKIGMMNLMKDIKFPGALPSGSATRVHQRHPHHSGGQDYSHPSGQDGSLGLRPNVVYVTPDVSLEYAPGDGSSDCELGVSVKTE